MSAADHVSAAWCPWAGSPWSRGLRRMGRGCGRCAPCWSASSVSPPRRRRSTTRARGGSRRRLHRAALRPGRHRAARARCGDTLDFAPADQNRFLRYPRRFGSAVVASGRRRTSCYPGASATCSPTPSPRPCGAASGMDTRTCRSRPRRAAARGLVRPVGERRRRDRVGGREKRQEYARMLAENGYGALLFDRRGEGASEGDPNLFGWGGDRDLKAAIDVPRGARPTSIRRARWDRVFGRRRAAARDCCRGPRLRRSCPRAPARGPIGRSGSSTGTALDTRVFGVLTASTGCSATSGAAERQRPGRRRSAPGSVLFLYGEEGQPQGDRPLTRSTSSPPASRRTSGGARRLRTWVASDAQPDEYEQRVIAFFDEALLGPG